MPRQYNRAVHHANTKTDWSTPPEVFNPLNEAFHFTLDVAASPWNAKCERYFTEEMDAFKQIWTPHVCWPNPPYSSGGIMQWLNKAEIASQCGTTVVALLPDNTEQAWFQEHVVNKGQPHLFWPSRIKFLTPDGPGASPTGGSIVVALLPEGALLPRVILNKIPMRWMQAL